MHHIAGFYGIFDVRQSIYDEKVEILLSAVRDQENLFDMQLRR